MAHDTTSPVVDLPPDTKGPHSSRLGLVAVVATFGGLLFGVQSPHATHAEILGHLLALLRQGVRLDAAARQRLAEQFDERAMANAELADWAWQTHLATLPGDLPALRAAILKTQQAHLDDLLAGLLAADSPLLCLANGPAPEGAWH